MIDLSKYSIVASNNDGTPALTSGGVPLLYQINGLSFKDVLTWSPTHETLYDDRLAIPFTTRTNDPNGVKAEQLMAILIHRLESFQESRKSTLGNDAILLHLRSALTLMEHQHSNPA